MQLSYNNKNMLQAGLIIAGWDAHDGGSVYAIPLVARFLRFPTQSGALALLTLLVGVTSFSGRTLQKSRLHEFVVQALTHAMARDASSGGCVRTVTITSDGVKRDFCQATRCNPRTVNWQRLHQQQQQPESVMKANLEGSFWGWRDVTTQTSASAPTPTTACGCMVLSCQDEPVRPKC